MIALDGDGRVIAMSAGAARWAGVVAWHARGRGLVRELGWRFGAAAAQRIDDFTRADEASMVVCAHGRRGAIEVALVRGADRIYVALA